jgi:hypothetical protein
MWDILDLRRADDRTPTVAVLKRTVNRTLTLTQQLFYRASQKPYWQTANDTYERFVEHLGSRRQHTVDGI